MHEGPATPGPAIALPEAEGRGVALVATRGAIRPNRLVRRVVAEKRTDDRNAVSGSRSDPSHEFVDEKGTEPSRTQPQTK